MSEHAASCTYSLSCRLLAVLCFAIVAAVGCNNQNSEPIDVQDDPPVTSASDSPTAGLVDADSASLVGEFRFTDESGAELTEAHIDGKLAVVNFIFTTCPGTCPRQSTAMQMLQERIIKAESASSIRLVSLTVDPETDTPEVLRKYAAQYDADPSVWRFLTGDRDAIWSFSKESMGMPVAPNPDDPLIPIAHESKFALIDRTGRIRGYFDALDEQGFESLWKAIDVILPEFTPNADLLAAHGLSAGPGHMAQPANILDAEWLDEMAAAERSVLEENDAVPSLRFTEALESTGITFVPQIVDDQRHRLLVNHYDHGNSLSVADVDGDGHHDLYFVSQVGPNELWRNVGDGSFENITETAGVGLADRISVAGSFCDIDNDGDSDLFVTTIRSGNALFLNDGSGKFTDITRDAGLEYTGHSSKGTFLDYDRDGLPDLFLCNVGKFTTEEKVEVRRDICNSQPKTQVEYYVGRPDAFSGHLASELTEVSILYRNLGEGKFADVTESVGLHEDAAWSGDAVSFDANHDGWPDLYVCNMQGHDRLYINQEGKSFADQTKELLKATPWGTMGAAVFDFDNNGLLDLYLTDMHSDMSKDIGPAFEKEKADMQWPEEFLKSDGRSIYGNAFYRQTEPGVFEELSDSINAENYWPWGLSYGDFNADGFQDAFLCSSMCFPYRYSINSLLLNAGGKRFLDAQFATGIEPRKPADQIAPWFAVDFSGDDRESRLAQGRSGTHVVWSATGTRTCAVFDYDGDGDLDIITNEFNTKPQVFRSNAADSGSLNHIKVRLRGSAACRDALGAIVVVKTTSGEQRQICNGTSGYLSQSVLPLYFGLGENTTVDEVKVIWPSGREQITTGPIDAGQLLEIEETAAP